MNFKQLIKSIENKGSLTLYGGKNDEITIEHNYDYVYSIKLNKCAPRDFLLSEAATWLDFYESKRGALRLTKEVQMRMA